MKKHNFNAGPCVLPREAVESAIEAIRDFDNTGIGLLEISHRTPGWERIMAETEQLWRDLLNIPDDYAVMFLGGGASTQFFEVPANLLKKKAAYLQTGVWAKKAAKEAKFYGEVEIVASSEDKNYTYIPKGYKIPTDADYFHITTNNTIYGTEIHEDIDEPSGRCEEVRYDLRRCAEERRSCRRDVRHHPQGSDRQLGASVADDGQLRYALSRRGSQPLDVQHASRTPDFRNARNPEVGEGTGRCRGHV